VSEEFLLHFISFKYNSDGDEKTLKNYGRMGNFPKSYLRKDYA
jgi:hypothetical protein